MAEIDFENEAALKEEQALESGQTENEESGEGLNDFIQEAVETSKNDIESGDDPQTSETDLGQDAVTLFEDDNFIFTSEGIINKESLNSDTEDNSEDSEPKGEQDEKILGKFNDYDELINSYQEIEKKLGKNSDAVNKLRELNPVLPMLEAMLGDETFLEMAENYFTNPEAQAEALKRQIGVDDNFVFDLNNALSDPKSEDAKVLNRLMQAKTVTQPKNTHNNTNQTQTDTEAKKQLMEKYGISESEFEETMAKAQNHTISHDDIYFLMNRESIIKKAKQEAAKEAQKNFKEQLSKAKELRSNRPSSGSSTKKTASPEDMFMQSLSAGKGLFE